MNSVTVSVPLRGFVVFNILEFIVPRDIGIRFRPLTGISYF